MTSRTLAVLIALSSGCESTFRFPGVADVQEADVATEDTADDAHADAAPECPATVCQEAGSLCVPTVGADGLPEDGLGGDAVPATEVLICALDPSGCLLESRVVCPGETTCVAGTCVEAPDPCDQRVDRCTGDIGICEGATAVTCEPDATGCKVIVRRDCAETAGGSCLEGVCSTDPCFGKTLCAEEKLYCDGAILRECREDEDGCLTTRDVLDCGATPGGACSDGPPPRCTGEIVGDLKFSVIADAGTTNPAGAAFTVFDRLPSFFGDRVVFRASTAAPAVPVTSTLTDAVYTYETGTETLNVVARAGEPLPDAPASTFSTFEAVGTNGPRVDALRVVFVGSGTDSHRGVYSQGGLGLVALVNRDTLIPGAAGSFVGLGDPIVSFDRIAFNGNDFGNISGAYTAPFDLSGAARLADNGTAMPNGASAFSGVSVFDLDSTYAVLVGFGKAPIGASYGDIQRGIYRQALTGGAPVALIDRTAAVPGVPGDTFSAFAGPVLSAGNVIFVGSGAPGPQKPLGPVTYKALYSLPLEGGTPEALVDTTTPMPGAVETFAAEAPDGLSGNHLCADGAVIYFRGTGVASGVVTQVGLYRVFPGGDVTRLLDRNTTLSGKKVADVRVGRRCASGGRVVIHVTFEDASEAILLGEPAPPVPQ
ncbi:MAG: hypothetical protein IV100_33465 [Myxococcales bacterium]|nr:hypothetical protein [Myxococcales bacterium]